MVEKERVVIQAIKAEHIGTTYVTCWEYTTALEMEAWVNRMRENRKRFLKTIDDLKEFGYSIFDKEVNPVEKL